jgi:hypothetical protein
VHRFVSPTYQLAGIGNYVAWPKNSSDRKGEVALVADSAPITQLACLPGESDFEMTTVYIKADVAKDQAAVLAGLMILGAGAAWLILGNDVLYFSAAIYAIGFSLLSWFRPEWALAGVFAAAPFQNDLSAGGPARFSIAEINLLLASVVFAAKVLVRRDPIIFGPVAIPIIIYLCACLLSSMGELDNTDTIISMVQMIVYLVAAVVVFASSVTNPDKFIVSLYGLLIVGVALSLIELASGSFYILGLQKNGLGSSLGAAFLVGSELWISNAQPKWRWLIGIGTVICAAGLLFSLSRGAWLGALAGFCIILGVRREFTRLLQLLVVIVPFIIVVWVFLPPESKEYATNLTNSESAQFRYANANYAYNIFLQNPIYGTGVAIRKEFDDTNLALSTLAETGVLGMVSFVLIHLVFFGMVIKTLRMLRPRDRWYTFPTLGAALLIMKFMHGMVDHYWSRGTLTSAWAGVGMATAVYFAVRRRRFRQSQFSFR